MELGGWKSYLPKRILDSVENKDSGGPGDGGAVDCGVR
jgi:hypothetical protein